MLRNWNSFIIAATAIITIILFASDKITFETMLNDLELKETLWVSLKTVLVIFTGVTTMALMVVVLLIDVLISIITRSEFPITHLVYDFVYLQFTRGWYWDAHSGSHIFMACIILFGLGILSMYVGPVRRRKKKFIYYKQNGGQ
ncbi:MAG: hypothetical protein ACK4VN_10455 [Bacteroidales bacterium]